MQNLRPLNTNLEGISSTLSGGIVEFTSRSYAQGDCTIDGEVVPSVCELIYMRLYCAWSGYRSILIGTMISTDDEDTWYKYVASPVILVSKQVNENWYGWNSLVLTT